LTAIATYFLTKELWNAGAGLFAAAFIAIAPGYISRSVAGSFDNEGIAIFALQCSFFLWIRAMRTGSMFWGIMTAFCYFYMVSAWGGYVPVMSIASVSLIFQLRLHHQSHSASRFLPFADGKIRKQALRLVHDLLLRRTTHGHEYSIRRLPAHQNF